MNLDYYSRLGVSRDASDADIKSAFRGLAKRYHPDLHPNDPSAEAAFKSVNEAYAVLSESSERRAYDATLGFPDAAWVRRAQYQPRRRDRAAEPQGARSGARPGAADAHADAGWDDPSAHIDFETWARAHYGRAASGARSADAMWTAERVSAAFATGFSSFNDPRATAHQNWEARRAARESAAAWAASSTDHRDATETRDYRAWAEQYKVGQVRATRAWPRAITALTVVGIVGYYFVFSVMRKGTATTAPRGAGPPSRSAAAAPHARPPHALA